MSNLEHLKKLVNDEVTHHDADQLLIAIGDRAKSGEKHIAIVTGDF